MSEKQIIKSVIREVLPDECGVIGSHNLETICLGADGMILTQDGRNFPIVEILHYIEEAVNFAAAAVTIWGVLRQKTDPKTQITQQFLTEVKKIEVKNVQVDLPEDVKEAIIAALLKKLEHQQKDHEHQKSDLDRLEQ